MSYQIKYFVNLYPFFKKISRKLLIMGIIFSGIVLTGVVVYKSFLNLSTTGEELDRTSSLYINDSVVAISTNWNKKELLTRASDELKSQASEEEIDELFRYLNSKLGKLKVYIGADGESKIIYYNTRKEITANYIVKAEFEKGDASINISLVRKDDKWYIYGYKVYSELLKPY